MSQVKAISILNVEDHPVGRLGVSMIIGSQTDMRLVAEASTGEEAIAEFRHHRPDITLMNLRLIGADGIDVLTAIRSEFPEARIIMFTSLDDDREIRRAFKAGAWGYILKHAPADELLAAIRSVHSGKQLLPETRVRIEEVDLTARELEVLQLIYAGYRNKQIADKLATSENAIKFHVKNIVAKLGANDRAHAVSIAVRRGLLQV